MTEAIARHQADLVYNYLSRYKVPELVRVIRGETMSPLSLLLWAFLPGCGRCSTMSPGAGVTSYGALFTSLRFRLEPRCQLRMRRMTWSRWKNFLPIELTLILRQTARGRHSAQRCAIGAEASLVCCYSIGLIATFALCPPLLLLLMGTSNAYRGP